MPPLPRRKAAAGGERKAAADPASGSRPKQKMRPQEMPRPCRQGKTDLPRTSTREAPPPRVAMMYRRFCRPDVSRTRA
eukprot:5690164-Pyramimonas_sp.AAC.1